MTPSHHPTHLASTPFKKIREGGGTKKAAKGLEKRTLTNLYNALNVYRGIEKMRIVPEAGDFAPRLDELHRTLDAAVCAAYGWPLETLANAAKERTEEEILRLLLALNLARAGK